MLTVNFLEESDLKALIPIVSTFADQTKIPFSQALNEVTLSFYNPSYLTIVAKDEERGIVSYLTGYQLSSTDFMITQFYSIDPNVSKVVANYLDSHLISCGVSRIVILSIHHPRVFSRYGFKLERYAMSKTLNGGAAHASARVE